MSLMTKPTTVPLIAMPAHTDDGEHGLDCVEHTAHTTDDERAILQELVEAVGTGDTKRILDSAKTGGQFSCKD